MGSSTKYYAKGKLLITGEYAVLDGAKALAIPCNLGQWLEVVPISNPNSFLWESIDVNGNTWLDVAFDKQLNILTTSDLELAQKLQHLLLTVHGLDADFSSKTSGFKVTTRLEFDRAWGLGSSSTLVHLLSQWAKVNPYKLLKNTFGGSGYDIACADADSPILFQITNSIPEISPTDFHPAFTHKMWFIHLNEKQISRKEIAKYSDLEFDRDKFANQITQFTDKLLETNKIQDFISIIEEHEKLVSTVLGIPTIKEERFPEVSGCFKSLGAWGGDFVLFIGDKSELKGIQKLGYSVIIPWKNMLINSTH